MFKLTTFALFLQSKNFNNRCYNQKVAAFNLGVSEAVKVFPNIIRQSCNAATSFSKSIMQGLQTVFFMFQEKLGTRPTEFSVSVAISFFCILPYRSVYQLKILS